MVNNDNTTEIALPNILELYGEDARKFDEYDKRPLTEEEKQLLIESDKVYDELRAKNR